MADAKRLIALGMVPPLAKEVAAQITAGVGNARRLVELSTVPILARELANQINSGTGNARRLAELGMVPVMAKEVAAQVSSTPIRQISTRTFVPDQIDTTNLETMTESYHVARADSPTVGIVIGGWYIGAGNAEIPLGADLRFTWSVSKTHTGGSFVQGKTDGAVEGIAAPGQNKQSDLIPFPVTAGDILCIRVWRHGDAGVGYQADTVRSTNDYMVRAPTTADLTMSASTITAFVSGRMFAPLAVVGQHGGKAVGIIGDSRSYGVQDTYDSDFALGEVARSITNSLPYLNLSRRSISASQFTASSVNRRDLLKYCSDVICNMGVNDFFNDNDTLATAQADLNALWNLLPSTIRLWATTITPYTTSTDSWATEANQTIPAKGVNIAPLNTWILTKPNPKIYGVFDIAPSVTEASGKWKSPGYTADGLHALNLGMLAIRDGGGINPATILAAP
jgi:hypothetical protein